MLYSEKVMDHFYFVGEPQGQQHMAGVQGTGGTGRARGGADALQIQHQQQGFPLHPFKGDVHVAGEAVFPAAVEPGAGQGKDAERRKTLPPQKTEPTARLAKGREPKK